MEAGTQRRACPQAPPTSYLSRGAAHPSRFALRSLSYTAEVSDPELFNSLVALSSRFGFAFAECAEVVVG